MSKFLRATIAVLLSVSIVGTFVLFGSFIIWVADNYNFVTSWLTIASLLAIVTFIVGIMIYKITEE